MSPNEYDESLSQTLHSDTQQESQHRQFAFIQFIVADFERFNICDLSIHSGHLLPYDLQFLHKNSFPSFDEYFLL